MDPYAPKDDPLRGMSSCRTKGADPNDVQAGQWWRLGDLPDVGLIGDGGEARAVLLDDDDEVLFRLIPTDWVVQTAPGVFEKFTNEEFNEHFQMVVRDTLSLGMSTKPKEKAQNGTQKTDKNSSEINRETRQQEFHFQENSLEEEK